jgi:hypothetical protein
MAGEKAIHYIYTFRMQVSYIELAYYDPDDTHVASRNQQRSKDGLLSPPSQPADR